jgi:hypothetical protein
VLRLLRRAENPSDTFVDAWKKAWIAGAHARWANVTAPNPFSADPARAAWNAGHLWAGDNPDRRTSSHIRLAHPMRRSTDKLPRIVRAAEIGALGLGALAAARWAWRRRKDRKLEAVKKGAD